MVAVPPIHIVVSGDAVRFTAGGDPMVTVVSMEHPFASAAVMVYVPEHSPLKADVGAKAPPLKLYWVAEAEATVMVPSQDPLQVSSVKITDEKVTAGGPRMFHPSVSAVHPLSSVTVRSYVPGQIPAALGTLPAIPEDQE